MTCAWLHYGSGNIGSFDIDLETSWLILLLKLADFQMNSKTSTLVATLHNIILLDHPHHEPIGNVQLFSLNANANIAAIFFNHFVTPIYLWPDS